MPAGIETYDGQVAFALRGEPAWHGMANVLYASDDIVTTEQMLKDAKLAGWNVRLVALSEFAPDFNYPSDYYLVIRDNPFIDGQQDVLHVSGERYREFQNEDLLAFGDNVLAGGGYWESAGSIKGGKVVFGSLKIDREIVLDPKGASDKTALYLLVTTSHNGSLAVMAMVTPVRVVCQNTLNMAVAGNKQSFKIRHTQSVKGRVDEARKALDLTFRYADAFEAEAQALFEQSITDKQFFDIITAVYPQPDEDAAKAALTKWENKITLINDLYYISPTTETIRGTAWGAYNALTERLDWYRTGRGDNKVENVAAAASGFDPVTNAEKNKILAVVKEKAFA